MSRPLPRGQISIPDAVKLIIKERCLDRVQKIEAQAEAEFAEFNQKFKPSGDAFRDALIGQHQPSAKIKEELKAVVNDARAILRQWLCDDEFRAQYFEPTFGAVQEIPPGIWQTGQSDGTIENGVFFPFGRPLNVYDQKQPVQVSIPLDRLKEALGGNSLLKTKTHDGALSGTATPLSPNPGATSRGPGRQATVVPELVKLMRPLAPSDLDELTAKALALRIGSTASRGSIETARAQVQKERVNKCQKLPD